MLALLLALTSPTSAAEVLFPEATPIALDDFSVAYIVYEMVYGEVANGLFDIEGGESIRKWAGADADGCFDNDACPANLWDRTDARLALVMAAGAQDGGTAIEIRFYAWNRREPLRVMKDIIPGGTELAYAKDVSIAVAEVLAEVPRRPTGPLPAAKPPSDPAVVDDEPMEDDDPAPAAPRRTPQPPPEEEAEPEPPRRTSGSLPADDEEPERRPSGGSDVGGGRVSAEDQRALGVSARLAQKWRESGMTVEAWRDAERIRSRRVSLELAGGWGMGNTDRGYGVWVGLENQNGVLTTTAASTWEGAGVGMGVSAWAGLGYAPVTWLEVGLNGGIQQGKKYLEAGWECGECNPASDEVPFDPVTGTQLWISPKIRLHPVAAGVIKPYLLTSLDLSFYDGFVAETTTIAFPGAEGGLAYGVGFGGGIAVDATPDVSFFAEVPYSLTMSPVWRSYDDPAVATQPAGLTYGDGLLRFVGGVSLHL